MPGLTIKNVPDRLYRALKTNARAHRRSLNGEIISCLERALGSTPVDPDEFLARVARFRRGIEVPRLTDRRLREAKEAGRP